MLSAKQVKLCYNVTSEKSERDDFQKNQDIFCGEETQEHII